MRLTVRRGEVAEVDDGSRLTWRLRTIALCTVLTGLAFLQAPGLTVADSKTDLVVDPLGWLVRAAQVWYPEGTFGQLQNQAYGYLWPIGPFFVVGDWLGLPPWVVQRLWWALLMCVAATGVIALAGRLRIGTPTARLIAGAAFALSPRILTELGPISIEAWPSAVAPWVLVPLAGMRAGQSRRTAIVRSAIVVAWAGGANATAVLAVVPLAILLLASTQPAGRRWSTLGGWCLAVGAATAWWLVPLLLLGRYSPPFLDYIETADVTTRVTDLTTVLRGASHWLGYYSDVTGPAWPAGWRIATEQLPVVATLVVVAFGVAGLARRGMPHRRWLVTGLLVGLALVGLGHVGTVDGLAADLQRQFLDGAGAPLRNVHKFDVVLRLPLILGLAHLLGTFDRSAAAAGLPGGSGAASPTAGLPGGNGAASPTAGRGWHPARKRAAAITAAALAAIIGVASPALTGGLAQKEGYTEVPGYWREAAGWLDERLERDNVLVVPAARAPRYLWGTPTDEIAQSLLHSGWGVRNSIPLTPPMTIRLLDTVESALASGAGSAGLADLLARSGVRYLLVRSDLNYGASGAARPIAVHQALDRSPGIRSVRGFGPIVGNNKLFGGFVDEGLDVPVRALEVFEVDRAVDRIVAYDASSVTTVVGGPESLLHLAAAGQLTSAPTVLAGDHPTGLPLGEVAITDGLRRREVTFGLPYDAVSGTLTKDEPARLGMASRDFLPRWGDGKTTVVHYEGIRGVTAASSWAQANPLAGARPAYQPYAALDGDPGTAWRSAPGSIAQQQWLEVELSRPQVVAQVRLRFDLGADLVPTRISVVTGAETVRADVVDGVAEVRLAGVHATGRVRVDIDQVAVQRVEYGQVGIAELEIPEVTAERTMVVPEPPATHQPASMVFAAAPSVPSCFFLADQPRCADGVARASEDGDRIDRTVHLPTGGAYRPELWVRAKPGPALDALLDREVARVGTGDDAPSVVASSTRLPEPATRAGAVLDGDPATAWSPAVGDPGPWLRMTWPSSRTITGLKVTAHPEVAASRPSRVQVIGDRDTRSGTIGPDGTVTFDQPMESRAITVLFRADAVASSYDPYTNRTESLPIAVGELSVLPGPAYPLPELWRQVTLPCGSGPELTVGGVPVQTAITTTVRELLETREMRARICVWGDGTVPVEAGQNRIVATASELATPVRLALTASKVPARTASDAPLRPTPLPVRVDDWSATNRLVRLESLPVNRVLAMRENTNPGWRATVGGRTLTPIVVDGWQQGWLVPAGVGGQVRISMAPATPYRVGLTVGAGLLLGVVVLAVLPARRRADDEPAEAAEADLTDDPATADVTAAANADVTADADADVDADVGVDAAVDVDDEPTGGRDWLLSAIVGGIALLLVGGAVAGALAGAGIGAVALRSKLVGRAATTTDRRRLRRFWRQAAWLLPVACFALAGWQSAVSLDPHRAAAPQLAALAAVAALWLSVVVPDFRRGRRARTSRGRQAESRNAGRSTA